MKCTILHEGKGRMRVHVEKVRMTLHRADVLEAYLNHNDAIVHAAVYERTGDVVITYTGKRTAAIAILAGYKFDVAEYDALVTSADSRRLNREYQDKMFDLVAGRCLRKLFLPAPLDAAYTAFRSIRFLWKGVRCVLSRRLEVEVLDALSIGVSLLRGDFGTAGSVMFLLNLGSLLEEWTRKKSLDDLARSMALNVDKVWVRSQGTEVLVPLTKVRSGDEVVVRSGNMIPLDGTVLEGEAMVNQAALTGEAMPVRKAEGSTLYAGTVVEEGECVFIAKAEGGSNRYDKIVAMIEESEKLKSSMVSGRNGGHLSAHPQRHPRHLLPDGGFLLRAQALHAAGRAFRHARVRQLPHHRQGRQVSGSAVSGRHYRVRQDRHSHPCHPAGSGGRALLRLQRARSSAAGRMSGRALPPFHGQRRGACRQRARHFP